MSRKMTRREFVGTTAALAGGAVATAYAEPVRAPLLPQRVLGKTNVRVSLLGLGGVGFLTDFEDKEQIAGLIHEIMDAGVNYFDTAPAYGKSEESLGLVMSTPVAVVVPAVSNREQFRANLDVARSFKPMSEPERNDLIARVNPPQVA
ncbi:twin-arginine translocation signal domain-containing protein [Candidatus Poribacteria bacterium]|nr:twin-arginine translocation signal domain-containing protein [Candidatus Poribacteria bacterium]